MIYKYKIKYHYIWIRNINCKLVIFFFKNTYFLKTLRSNCQKLATTGTHSVVSKYHSSLKGIKTPGRNFYSRSGARNTQDDFGTSYDVWKPPKSQQNDRRATFKGLPWAKDGTIKHENQWLRRAGVYPGSSSSSFRWRERIKRYPASSVRTVFQGH